MMKSIQLSLILAFLFNYGMAQTKNFIDQPYIEVNGVADSMVTPNEIYIKIILTEKDTRDRVSLEDLEKRMVAALTALGHNTEKDLTTSDMSSNFRFYLLKAKDVLKSKIYILKVTDAVQATKVFMKLEENDISNISIERVDHSDLENINNIVRSKAILNAKERAIALTKPVSQQIGNAIFIADTGNFNQELSGRAPGLVIRGMNSLKADYYKETPKIEFEKIKVNASINVKFILK